MPARALIVAADAGVVELKGEIGAESKVVRPIVAQAWADADEGVRGVFSGGAMVVFSKPVVCKD